MMVLPLQSTTLSAPEVLHAPTQVMRPALTTIVPFSMTCLLASVMMRALVSAMVPEAMALGMLSLISVVSVFPESTWNTRYLLEMPNSTELASRQCGRGRHPGWPLLPAWPAFFCRARPAGRRWHSAEEERHRCCRLLRKPRGNRRERARHRWRSQIWRGRACRFHPDELK